MFKTTSVFDENKDSKEHIIINQGGTSSSKTYSLIQLLYWIAANNAGYIITVVGESIPNLRKGAYRDAEYIYSQNKFLEALILNWNKTERIIYFRNGSIVEFTSYENEQSARAGKRDVLFINEANGISYDLYFQLAMRTRKKIFIDYNPTSEFWVHEKLIGKDGVKLIVSDHRHNTFLSEFQHNKIEELKDHDTELFHVYARGKTGRIDGLVFKNWNLVKDIPQDAKFIAYGLDFGFTNDPTALVEMYEQNGELWVNELLYSTGLTNPDICLRMIALGVTKDKDIIADSAEPKSIHEIYSEGYRIYPAKKGADSIQNGIDILKRYNINVTMSSLNLRKELSSYVWKKDKDGKHTGSPIDCYNHCIDPMRYIALNKLALKTKLDFWVVS